MAAPCPLLGDAITDDTLLNIARFLPTAKDLLCLKLTNSRFAAKIIASAPSGAGASAAAAPEMVCIAEEAGRLWVAAYSEQELGWVPRRALESWLCLMREVELLRVPLLFGRAHDDITLSEGGVVATKSAGHGYYRSVASKVMMRSGRHFVQLTVERGDSMMLGVIRPGWDVEGRENADLLPRSAFGGVGHCFYDTCFGHRTPGMHDWEGRQTAAEQGDRVGMLLDLDQGSMTVWKNGTKLGVMRAEGLSGPLCWAVDMAKVGTSARVESAPAPPSPTDAEVAVAKAWKSDDESESDDE